jgi:hypothetical protein
MAAASPDVSMFQQKYNEFVEDLRGTLPEYEDALSAALVLSAEDRLTRFQQEVKTANMFHENKNKEAHEINPRRILPGVELTDAIWMGLSENTQKAIWEHTRVLSICCLMEAGFSQDTQPKWVEDAFSQAMKDVQDKMKSTDLEGVLKTFMAYFESMKGSDDTDDSKDDSKDAQTPKKGLFENGFPSLPEKFMKGHLARLAQEIVKDITPADLGITAEQLKECEKDPSRAIHILFSTFTERPDVIQKVVAKIGKRLQQKVASGSIRPQEIAREAEEMMKEFSENSSFVDMMENIKRAFGMEDMDIARKTGNEGSARMSLVRDRLRRKLEKKKEAQAGAGAGAKGKSKK